MGDAFKNLGATVARQYARAALGAVAEGDIETAYKKAVSALELRSPLKDRQQLGIVFYEHGKFLMSRGRLPKAADDFAKAVECSDGNETFRLRWQTAVSAIGKEFHRALTLSGDSSTNPNSVRRMDVIEFCAAMRARHNVSIADLPKTPVLHFVRKCGFIHRPRVRLPEEDHLDEFLALGTYRWQGDEKRADEFSRWVRRLKRGEETVARHLARLLAEWIWSETEVLKEIDFLVTVPGEPQREAERGLNPPDMLASAVQDLLGVPLVSRVLKRTESARARELDFSDVLSSFSVRGAVQMIRDRNVLLLDDVATRGHTLRACTERLHDAGATRVVCLALAQAVSTLRESQALGT